MKRRTKNATVAMATCPYCEKNLKQPGWAPHIRRKHSDRPFLPFGSALAGEHSQAEAKATGATAACPYCEKNLKQPGWAPHIRRTHPDRPFLPFGSAFARESPKEEAAVAVAEADGAHAADVRALIVKIQERIAYLDASIANVKAMQEERERLAVAHAGLSQVLTQLAGQPAPVAAARL